MEKKCCYQILAPFPCIIVDTRVNDFSHFGGKKQAVDKVKHFSQEMLTDHYIRSWGKDIIDSATLNKTTLNYIYNT